ncbi:MAG TPA: hypothetical protein VGP82_15075, partial [Ktedonobacterales bacterium]|nr:hypothetical protein [Ktedonobacterales bacterium]
MTRGGVELIEIDPAAIARDRPTESRTHPFGHWASTPAGVFRGGVCQGLLQFLLQRGREQRRHSPRGRVLAIVHARWALRVVALGDLPDPVGR